MEICRLCLESDNHLINVANALELCTKIKDCVSIEIRKNDVLSEYACTKCVNKVDDWYEFKQMCISSSRRLINQNSSDTEDIKTESNDVKEEEDIKMPLDISDDSSDFDLTDTHMFGETFLDTSSKAILSDNKYECSICSREFDICIEYLDHQEEHDGQSVFRCSKCPEVFSARKDLVLHDRNHKTSCPHCGIVIMESSLKLHLIKHTDRHVCPHCSNRFPSSATMAQHIITMHTNIKNHVCENCGKRFSSMTAMKVHLKSHSEIREYKCKVCSYAGKTASAVYVHMATHSKDVCVCEVCSKIFKSQRNLNDHLRRVHSDQKKHECHHCQKKFVDKYMLTVHLRSHTGVRPYRCNICDKAFIRSDGLKEHLATHGEREKHGCKMCGKQFTSKRGVVRHHCSSIS